MNHSAAPHSPVSSVTHHALANAIRSLSMDAVQQANSGHPGMPMGMADVATVLWREFLSHDPDAPAWADRDRFVLSAGHGSMLLYSLMYLTGYEDITLEELKQFRQLGAKTCGHPEYGVARGIETTTGPLGQGMANAVGMALAERILHAQFGDALVNHYTYCIVGDGCLMEGISQEAASLAAHLNLHKLIILFDDNGISIDGATSLSTSEDNAARFRTLGFHVQEIDGHDETAIRAALHAAKASDKPSFIACKTTIAYGAPSKAGTSASHGSPLGAEEIAGAKAALGIDYPAFELPEALLDAWRKSAGRGKQAHHAWQAHFAALPAEKQALFARIMNGELPDGWLDAMLSTKAAWMNEPKAQATRQSSQEVLHVLTKAIPALIGGSADLTGSNLTKTAATAPLSASNYAGRYIYYGVREHAMGAIMNGLALHGGVLPYAGTFLVFSDYMRTAIRLSALMRLGVVYVMTHDSIGVGEDGPTHQPIEHLASLRAIPNLYVMRPCDRIETLECWQLAMEHRHTPSLLALTRQALPQLRNEATQENKSALGAYALRKSANDQVTVIATGSEVHLAMQAAESLEKEGIAVRVVSMPCMELFFEQTEEYRRSVLEEGLPHIAVEAASSFGWHRVVGARGATICLDNFGESAPAPALYEHFGITVQAICAKVRELL